MSMERYLMTQSLLSSWLYTFNAPEEYGEEAMNDFLSTLNREPHETNEAMQNGIDFENLVTAILNGAPTAVQHDKVWGKDIINEKLVPVQEHKWYTGASKVAKILKGARLQVKAMRYTAVSGTPLLLYGILDGLKAGIIYDIKFLNKGMGGAELAGKYLESPQHPMYFEIVPAAYEFQYLVSDGTDLYIETYSRQETPPIDKEIDNFLNWLHVTGFEPIYKEKWLTK